MNKIDMPINHLVIYYRVQLLYFKTLEVILNYYCSISINTDKNHTYYKAKLKFKRLIIPLLKYFYDQGN